MAKRRKSPVKKGTLHLQPKNQGRAAAARMQAKGKLWKKVAKVRTKSAGAEKELHFYGSIDNMRRDTGGTKSKKAWLQSMRKGAATRILAKRKTRKKSA